LEITLIRITPYTGGQVPKKSLMIESAQTILGGIKENSQSTEGAHTKLGGIKNPKDAKF